MLTATEADLSTKHRPVSMLFPQPKSAAEWEKYRLTDEQVAFYHENGYLAGVRILDDGQIESLKEELLRLMDSSHPLHDLFYEYHSNESVDPSRVLFHAL